MTSDPVHSPVDRIVAEVLQQMVAASVAEKVREFVDEAGVGQPLGILRLPQRA